MDPSTVSSSPIRTFTRISDLSPSKKAGFLGQFDYSKKRKGSRPTGVRGRSGLDFDEVASGWYTVACIAKNCVYLREGGEGGGGREVGREGGREERNCKKTDDTAQVALHNGINILVFEIDRKWSVCPDPVAYMQASAL